MISTAAIVQRLSGLTVRPARRLAQAMGRPPKKDSEKKARLSITIKPSLMQAVEKLAEAEHRTISGTIEAALTEYVNARKNTIKKLTP